ncbi:MAG: glycosyltransferase family 4 protein, partial [Gemmatimonadaceae bacterium]
MRIFLYTTARAWTGSARALEAAARGLAARDHRVTYVCPAESEVEQRMRYDAYAVAPVADASSFPVAVLRLRRLLAENEVDVIFTTGEAEFFVAAAAARLTERPALVRRVAHGAGRSVRWRSALASRLTATFMLASSEDEAGVVKTRLAGVRPAVVPLGVAAVAYESVRPIPHAAIGVPGATGVIACVYEPGGRVRAAAVLRVMARLAPRHPDLRLVMVGRGSTDEDLRMHAAALRITRAVSFLGERDDHLAVLRAADLGWVVAGGDDAAFAMLDLMALAVPVLAERSALSRQYVADGIAGLLLPFDDSAETAAAVARLLAGSEERAAMGSAGRTRVARDFG